MNYIGEHLLPGKLGHFFVLLSFVSSLGATVAYFLHVQSKAVDQKLAWRKLARLFFLTEVIAVFGIFGTLYYLISHHYFEYKYVWQHSSRSLETKYLLSCFWEGQEGSFLLWSIWHCILGSLFIWKEKAWEGPVMTVISFAQAVLATMLIGIPFLHLGSNPFVLLRNSGVLDNAPAFRDMAGGFRQDYLSLITDGNGLNQLLQNYWMVIHPPVLFLGFASTIVPFAFAFGGLWTKRFGEWSKAALPWALFSAGILGTGIMMGAAWAYESLNFGGYWAWDPVENASLVPWLVLVAGVHTLVIYRHTGNALRTTYLFFLLSFLLVLYSTYLTRSGDLQDTSVHAFTGEGITKWHLRALLLLFLVPSAFLFIKRYKGVPFVAKEEEASSREFWMFIGSLVLFLSALLIIAMTSVPVINKLASLFTTKQLFTPLAVGEDAAYSYNRIQVFVAVILGLLTGVGLYFKYKNTGKTFLRRLLVPIVAGFVAGSAIIYFGDINYREKTIGYQAAIWFAVVAAVFSLIANAGYIWTGFRGSMKRAGGAISHVGFATLLIGILISSSKKEVLSYNTSGINLPLEENNRIIGKPGENLTLVKQLRTDMGPYWVTYNHDSADVKKTDKWFYNLKFEPKNGQPSFVLEPNAFVNQKSNQGPIANPDAKHYWSYDVFTYITSLPNKNSTTDTASFKEHVIAVGDTIFYSRGFVVLNGIELNPPNTKYNFTSADTALMAKLTVFSKEGTSYQSRPVLQLKNNKTELFVDSVYSQNLAIAFSGIESNQKVKLQIKESDAVLDFITIKAYKFPFINLVWLGTIVTVIGFFISMIHRRQQSRLTGKPRRVVRKSQEVSV